MDIKQVLSNIENTISGKTRLLEHLKGQKSRIQHTNADVGQELALFATIDFLEINLIELNNIKNDLVACLGE